MNDNKKMMFLAAMFLALFTIAACGDLDDPDVIWNQTREIEETDAVPPGTAEMTFTPGTFEGTGTGGWEGTVSVSVVIDDDGRIADIVVTDHNESPAFADQVFVGPGNLIDAVTSAGSTEVDAVSGATYTSTAFLRAIEEALDEAR